MTETALVLGAGGITGIAWHLGLIIGLRSAIPRSQWPDRPLLITAVDAASGEPVAWDGASGVPLNRAVAASCAVPCVFPPVTINGSRYMDGGVRSGTNADLAATAGRIVVLAPLAPVRMRGAPAAEIDALRERARVMLIAPDATAMDAVGSNVFDTSRWDAVIEAATAQGTRIASEVARVWRA